MRVMLGYSCLDSRNGLICVSNPSGCLAAIVFATVENQAASRLVYLDSMWMFGTVHCSRSIANCDHLVMNRVQFTQVVENTLILCLKD